MTDFEKIHTPLVYTPIKNTGSLLGKGKRLGIHTGVVFYYHESRFNPGTLSEIWAYSHSETLKLIAKFKVTVLHDKLS